MSVPVLGAHFATPITEVDGDWQRQKATFARGRFAGAKVMISSGFGWEPRHVEELIGLGARQIVLRTEDVDFTPARIRNDLVDGGFLDVVDAHPDVEFLLELGNEQNLHGMDPWVTRFWLIRTPMELSWLHRANLRWIASMPTDRAEVDIVLRPGEDGSVIELYHGLGAHLYGHFDVDDGGGGDWMPILNKLLTTDLPVYITEFGINHPLPDDEKAERYVRWFESLPASRVLAAYVYLISHGDRDPQYQVTNTIAERLAGLNADDASLEPEPEPPTGSRNDAIRQLQRWAKTRDPDFDPIRFGGG